jgi:L-ribulokinase
MGNSKYAIGLDFGTDTVRALIVNVVTGEQISTAVISYPRWLDGKYCDPPNNQFRQHPLDYIESMINVVGEALQKAGTGISDSVIGIGVDTTGSTPCPVDENGTPLAMISGFEDNPNAMFHLWKDHTAIAEANEINEFNQSSKHDYLRYVGGIYSSEWFWAKILHTHRNDNKVKEASYTWIEHCDWIPYLLTGQTDLKDLKRSRCAAGHKALWHRDFNGLPGKEFLGRMDPDLAKIDFENTFTSDESTGNLSPEWSEKLGLPESVVVAVGAFDAHMGAVGGQIEANYLSKVIGTSTCDIMITPTEKEEHLVKGICGQVDGSVIPGMLGLEAGQSAFGDVYAWFKELIMWPLSMLPDQERAKFDNELDEKIIPSLAERAAQLDPDDSDIISIDWFNGRRTPDANQQLKGAITGLNLGSDAPRVFQSLVESTCFGARKIADRFIEEGVKIDGVIALGGVAKKSEYVMQTLANVMNRPIKVGKAEQTCALGAAMFGATAAGAHESVEEAMLKMGAGFDKVYEPNQSLKAFYDKKYQKYLELGSFLESQTNE